MKICCKSSNEILQDWRGEMGLLTGINASMDARACFRAIAGPFFLSFVPPPFTLPLSIYFYFSQLRFFRFLPSFLLQQPNIHSNAKDAAHRCSCGGKRGGSSRRERCRTRENGRAIAAAYHDSAVTTCGVEYRRDRALAVHYVARALLKPRLRILRFETRSSRARARAHGDCLASEIEIENVDPRLTRKPFALGRERQCSAFAPLLRDLLFLAIPFAQDTRLPRRREI